MIRWLSALAVVCLVSAVAWHLTLGQALALRIPPGWSWDSQFVGFENDPDPETGGFQARNRTAYHHRSMTIHDAPRPGAVLLKDFYAKSDPEIRDTLREYVLFPIVDRRTGLHLDSEHRQEYAVLPQGLEKRTYVLAQSYVGGVPLVFVKEDVVEGLLAYVYSYEGRGEYTAFYQGTGSNDGLTIPPGHEIKCAGDHFSFVVWAEPTTGEILKIKESCLSGDYLYDVSTGKAVAPILRWQAETAGIDVVRQADAVRDRITQLSMARYLPLCLAALGLVFATAAGVRIGLRRA